ncbi:hypothetical protein GR198_08720 [Rhizobium leguminosarum]|uniref:hypothetical protein n=1 Tax=Rhizobium leguminosarum TaxID=384 RepID=UPI0013C0F54C|nr:hypothetical protein [Rhizobium leguminosarum]NEH55815.1 hypothetical protein [Rhizobium leguminosarum]
MKCLATVCGQDSPLLAIASEMRSRLLHHPLSPDGADTMIASALQAVHLPGGVVRSEIEYVSLANTPTSAC